MKAILYPARGEVSVTTLPDPTAGNDEVIVKVAASGICHTDFEVLNANYGTSAFPLVPGHEYSGTIVEVGSDVTGVSIGDRVSIDPNIECGTCRACQRGWAHLCEKLGAYGVTQNGGFAELSCVKASAVHPIGDLSFATAALAEPMGCVLNGVETVFAPNMENALIFGAGPMGLLMGIALQNQGISDISFVDIDDSRLALANSFGFGGIAAGSAELAAMHHGADLAVDATGAAPVASQLPNYIANGGKGLFFGVCSSELRVEISPFEIFRRQITLAGSHSLNHNIPAALKTIKDYGPDIERLVSHQLPLEDVAQILGTRPPEQSLKVQATLD
ncbi:zinc-dependent alcohol dehydrogenase family protein [Cochlodiniinecator piscidefendens]|uniref:zinc-dependent alcohol dehydrogenase family protein n=1 Tax=Cochlodiniinecator piscidefendens TaxID=2715756 RepID=UPI00140AC90E|nr:zinc-dependent alcohol dehydrogenase family protein [Cochlodiniinecator piscidefendens]